MKTITPVNYLDYIWEEILEVSYKVFVVLPEMFLIGF